MTFMCVHFQAGNVLSATCALCGPLVPVPVPPATISTSHTALFRWR